MIVIVHLACTRNLLLYVPVTKLAVTRVPGAAGSKNLALAAAASIFEILKHDAKP